MSHLQIGSFQIRRPIPGSRSTFLADRDGELFALKTHCGSVLDENWPSLSETLGRQAPTSERICTLREVGVQKEIIYAAAPYLDGYNVHQLIKAIGNAREIAQSIQHVRAVCWLIAQFARAADERSLASFNPSLFDDEGVAPEELFVTQSGQVMMLDPRWTGLRRLASGPETHTLAHMVAYSMPASWREGNVQVRTMLFALTTVLWELLAGYRLFRRESLVATLYRLSEHSVPNLTELNRHVPQELSRFVERMLGSPLEMSLVDFAQSLEIFSNLDSETGPSAVSYLVDEAFPAKLIEEEDGEASVLESFLEQQGQRWAYVEESTTFVAAPPSSCMEGDGELAWIAEASEIRLPPSTLRLAGRSAPPAVVVGERHSQIRSAIQSFMVGGAMCAVILLALRVFGLMPAPSASTFSAVAGFLEPGSVFDSRVPLPSYDGASPRSDFARSVLVSSSVPNFALAEIDVATPAALEPAMRDSSRFEETGPSSHPSANLPDSEVRPGDLLLILPLGTSASLGEKMLGSGMLKIQLAPGSYVLRLRSKEGLTSTLRTHIQAGTLNIVEVPVMKTFTQR